MRIETYFDTALDDGVVGLFDASDAKLALELDGWNVWIDSKFGQMIIKRFDDVLVLSDTE